MKFKQVAARFTGFSIPLFGVSWKTPKLEIDLAQRLINFLEDRRVLFNPYEMEMPEHCVQSVIELRAFLTDLIGELPKKEGLPEHLRSMRAACRRFVDATGELQRHGGRYLRGSGFGFALFGNALGELRAAMGFHIGAVASMHGLDISDELATILPPEPAKDDA